MADNSVIRGAGCKVLPLVRLIPVNFYMGIRLRWHSDFGYGWGYGGSYGEGYGYARDQGYGSRYGDGYGYGFNDDAYTEG